MVDRPKQKQHQYIRFTATFHRDGGLVHRAPGTLSDPARLLVQSIEARA